MKFLLLIIGISLSAALSPALAQSVQQLAAEGQRAFLANDVETAKTKFQKVLEMDPTHPTATGYMRMIKAQEAKAGAGASRKQVQSLVLPEVKFKEATFAEALEYLKQNAARQSVSVSFVVQPGVNRDTRVTLYLTEVPFLEAVRYVCELAGAQFSVEKFAIVIRSVSAGSGPS